MVDKADLSNTPIPQGFGLVHEVMAAEGRAAVAIDIINGKRKVQIADPVLGIWRAFEHPGGPDFWASRASDAVATTSILAYRRPPSPIHNTVCVIVSLLPPATEAVTSPAPAPPATETQETESPRTKAPAPTKQSNPPEPTGYQIKRAIRAARIIWPPDGEPPEGMPTETATGQVNDLLAPESRRLGSADISSDTMQRALDFLRGQ